MVNQENTADKIMGYIPGLSTIWGIGKAIFGKSQMEQQQELMDKQEASANRMAEEDYKRAMRMWEDTNYSAQMEQMKKAGLNPSMMYKGGGQGGQTMSTGMGMPSTTGAPDENARTAVGIQGAQTLANIALTKAQTENVNADTAKKKEEAPNIKQNTENTAFDLALKKRLENDNYEITHYEANKAYYSNLKYMGEYNAWSEANFNGMATDDPNTPMAKAMRAGIETTLENLKNAKLNNDIAEADKIIREFTASLAKQGIAEGTPWYVKMVSDMLSKAGININQTTADTLKN